MNFLLLLSTLLSFLNAISVGKSDKKKSESLDGSEKENKKSFKVYDFGKDFREGLAKENKKIKDKLNSSRSKLQNRIDNGADRIRKAKSDSAKSLKNAGQSIKEAANSLNIRKKNKT